MTYLISKYLDRNFTLVPKVLVDGSVVLVVTIKGCESVFGENTLMSEVNSVFEITDGHKFVESWKYRTLKPFTDKFETFLRDCYVTLGLTNWDVHHPVYGKLNEENVHKHMGGVNEPMVNWMFNNWYENKVIETSEKMMKMS